MKLRQEKNNMLGKLILIALTLVLFVLCLGRVVKHYAIGKSKEDGEKPMMVFVTILCDASRDQPGENSILTDFLRQYEQTVVLIKSALALSQQPLKFIIITDSINTYEVLINHLKDEIPDSVRSRLILERRQLWYPEEGRDILKLFRPCATARLFLPAYLDFDSMVYLDTDFIFVRPPEDLWNIFSNFNGNHIAALAPCLRIYNRNGTKVPHYGSSGLNAGMMLMNLTRIDQLSRGWINSSLQIYDQYKSIIRYADQDIINIFFSGEREILLHEIGCHWNIRSFHCSSGENLCQSANSEGISALHGTAGSYYDESKAFMKVVFDTWKNHDLKKPLRHLVEELERSFKELPDDMMQRCSATSTFADILLVRLKELVNHARLRVIV